MRGDKLPGAAVGAGASLYHNFASVEQVGNNSSVSISPDERLFSDVVGTSPRNGQEGGDTFNQIWAGIDVT